MSNEQIELLKRVLIELTSLIAYKNKKLDGQISCMDLDPPDYHDYQTCHEIQLMIHELEVER